jgi:hypothetical protein
MNASTPKSIQMNAECAKASTGSARAPRIADDTIRASPLAMEIAAKSKRTARGRTAGYVTIECSHNDRAVVQTMTWCSPRPGYSAPLLTHRDHGLIRLAARAATTPKLPYL